MKKYDHTELEEKLFNYILYLIGLINVYEKAFQIIYGALSQTAEWTNKNWEVFDRKEKYSAMMKDLNNEFDWNLTINDLDDYDILVVNKEQ